MHAPLSPTSPARKANRQNGPAWDIALLFPEQGQWSESEYLWLENTTGKRIEFTDGRIEVLPVPTVEHQLLVKWILFALDAFVSSRQLGTVLFSGLRVQLRPGKIREPDVVFLKKDRVRRQGKQFWDGADLAIEVVSEDDRDRDYVQKREEYAAAGIPEYWIVDPAEKRITLLTLTGRAKKYTVKGEYHVKDSVASVVLPGFKVSVKDVFAAADEAGRA